VSLGKACILLTAGPAAGKSTSILQLLAHALRDQEGTLVPIYIRVHDLQRNLLADRSEAVRLQERHQQERTQLESRHAKERELHMLHEDKVASTRRVDADIHAQVIAARQASEIVQVEAEQDRELKTALNKSSFATAWNWVDAHLRCVYGSASATYMMLRQAMLCRRALVLLDGIDECGVVSEDVQRHVTEVLAPQGHSLVITSRPDNLRTEAFAEHFEHLTLHSMSDELQDQLIDLRLREAQSSGQQALKQYIRTQVPLNAEGLRETCNPLMLSMMITVSESLGGGTMPGSKTTLYAAASKIMLERTLGGCSEHSISAPQAAIPYLMPLLEAIFFRAHATQKKVIEDQHVEAAALELGAPGQLAAMQWPPYKSRVRVGQVVKILRGDNAGRVGVLTSDSRGKLINGRTPRSPFRITFLDKSLSPWLKENALVSSGLDLVTFDARVGSEGQRKSIRTAYERLPLPLHQAVEALRTWALQGQLPLLALLQSHPLQMQASHISLQEFFCARALFKGMALPGEPPWRWSAWWGNTLHLGSELGSSFGSGLLQAAGAGHDLDLSGQIAGHRPTALAAISQMVLGLSTVDLSQNGITPEEVRLVASALQKSNTLIELNLAKNPLGDDGAEILSSCVATAKLTSLNLFGTGIKERGARSLSMAISFSPSLTHLNLQYNAVRGESKKALEAANAARVPPLFLVL